MDFLAMYSIQEGKLELTNSDEFLAFFSRPFLKSRKWSVIPLWEGNLTQLLKENNESLFLMKKIREICLLDGINFLYKATVEATIPPYAIVDSAGQKILDDAALNIAIRKVDLHLSDLEEFFSPTDVCCPHWGNNFFWPQHEKFVIYSTGDSAAFLVGEKKYIENLVEAPFDYCMDRFAAANLRHQSWHSLIKPFQAFCREFANL